jgi:hypothetical protein
MSQFTAPSLRAPSFRVLSLRSVARTSLRGFVCGTALVACSSESGTDTLARRALVADNTAAVQQIMPVSTPPVVTPDQTAGAAGASATPPGGTTTGTAGTTGTTGTTTTTPTDPNAASGPPQECKGPQVDMGIYGTPAPPDGLMVDFTNYTMPAGSWGDTSVNEITGGTSLYSGTPADALTQSATAGTLELKANISVGGYTGIVLWFTPCVNATAFTGVEFPATGSLGGATMILKMQTSPDYPVDVTNTKGKCPFTADSNKFNECVQPFLNITALPTTSVTVPWSQLASGVPMAAVDPAQLLGFELQFQCPATASAACALDLKLGSVNFTK